MDELLPTLCLGRRPSSYACRTLSLGKCTHLHLAAINVNGIQNVTNHIYLLILLFATSVLGRQLSDIRNNKYSTEKRLYCEKEQTENPIDKALRSSFGENSYTKGYCSSKGNLGISVILISERAFIHFILNYRDTMKPCISIG